MRKRKDRIGGSRLGALAVLLTVCLWTAIAGPSMAQVTFHIDDEPGFDAAVTALSYAGTEDFESSTLPPQMITLLEEEPLAPGVPNYPFPSGTNVATGLTVQSNTLGDDPPVPSPGGDLITASVGFEGTPTDQISVNATGTSLDMIFGLSDTNAVSFTPLVFDAVSSGDPGTATIRVYDTDNTLIGTSVHVPVAGFMNPTTFVGVVADPGVAIGRINVFGTISGGNAAAPGADNIDVYTEGTATPGEASGPSLEPLRASLTDAATGELAVTYGPACAATNHNLYYGPLDQVGVYGWSGEICTVGANGSVGGFNPGTGSYFFVVVGHDGDEEGSYGSRVTGGSATERPPFFGNLCGQTQSLGERCD